MQFTKLTLDENEIGGGRVAVKRGTFVFFHDFHVVSNFYNKNISP